MAALMLRECGYDGNEAVYDPMCGSGTFVIEAAEIARGLFPGRTREFAFQSLANFEPSAFEALKNSYSPKETKLKFYGSDRDQGAVKMSKDNADRAGVLDLCDFTCADVTKITAPDCPPGLVIINPPYGARIGNKKPLYGLYKQIGDRLLAEFKGWRVGIVTSEPSLAKATGLPFVPTTGSISHGGLRVTLFRTDPI
jgi:putative N6-adenine-specific DNA methylase